MSSGPQAIIALDVPSLLDARSVVAMLGDRATFYKVGLQLFAAEGPKVVDWLHERGKRVFLDLKLHDIPRTVQHATESARRLGVALVTVHGLGGPAMVRAAVEAASDTTGVLVVTVLTSFDLVTASEALGRQLDSVEGEVLRLAAIARASRAHGVVCGGTECAAVRSAHGDGLRALVPGIRAAGSATDDQARVATAREAAVAGAGYVVLGRIVTRDPDPPVALERVLAELA